MFRTDTGAYEFQSRNRETYDSNLTGSDVVVSSINTFQSRNRETYDSNTRNYYKTNNDD